VIVTTLAPSAGSTACRFAERVAVAEDEPFFDRLYEETGFATVLGWGFDPAFGRAFLRQQARIRRGAYALQFPGAEYRVLLCDGAPSGRLVVWRDDTELSLVDIAVLPEQQRRGLGSWAIRRVQGEARALGLRVRLSVEGANPARALYARLGFRELPGDERGGVALDRIQMAWTCD
jgi:ribosomal protein S18 acetylase RimI-like enzyme